MSFRKILDTLVSRSGALGAVMVAGDGEVVEASAPVGVSPSTSTGEALELDLIGAHYAVILDLCKGVAEMSPEQLGPVETLMVSTGNTRLAVTVLKEGYMVVAIMERAAVSGRVMYESMCAVDRIEQEMG